MPLAFLGLGAATNVIIELTLLNVILAYSAYIVMAGGAFAFGYVAYIAIGAYVAAICSVNYGLGIVPALFIAVAISGVVAYVIGKPLQRLQGVYVALTSVAIVVMVQIVAENLSITGGPGGKSGLPDIHLHWEKLAIIAGAMALLAFAVDRSMVGRAMRLLRSDEIVARHVGVNTKRLGISLAVASAMVGAVGGVLRAYYFRFVIPDDYNFLLIIDLQAIVILGGMTYWFGPLIGSVVWTLLPEYLNPYPQWRLAAQGALLLVVCLAAPTGIAGVAHDGVRRLRRLIIGPVDTEVAGFIAAEEVPLRLPEARADTR